ncbi:allophanate hydrolase [Tistrella bauzanensis]|uniref:allophanate hydrolase n=1 Tax=Tistrella TaxID=171436 RepID=UPI0031F6C1CF
MTEAMPAPIDIARLQAAYQAGQTDPLAVVRMVLARIAAWPDPAVFILLRDAAALEAEAQALVARGPAGLRLYGIPFAVKDNIDVAGLPTTAACPEFTYTPEVSATVVDVLRAAGALLIGKTNLDQFATGLVGVRSPWGAPRSPFNADYVSGGSSSGSAVATSAGLVSFALGTDTAGSGRVPAAFTNTVGLKPSIGLISARGVVPACRSLDCVTIFAQTADDAATVLDVAAVEDAGDSYSRRAPWAGLVPLPRAPAQFRFGVPAADGLAFFGDDLNPAMFQAAVARLEALGGTAVEIDLAPFLDVARLLYEGPWVAERTAAVGDFLAAHPDAGHPVVRGIIEGGHAVSGVAAFRAQYRLEALRRVCDAVWADVDLVVTPTAGTTYTVAAVEADPVRLNSTLGYYTNFMNLLDYAAVAVPAGFRADGLPFGVTLFAPAMADRRLLSLGDRLHRAAGLTAGATGLDLAPASARGAVEPGQRCDLAVVGAHMEGLPLNGELLAMGARLVARTCTAPVYRLYALDGLQPPRPGLVRVADGGAAIALEVWSVPTDRLGRFVAGLRAPLGLGQVELASGDTVAGFLCEAAAVAAARDITGHGGWRAWLDKGQAA